MGARVGLLTAVVAVLGAGAGCGGDGEVFEGQEPAGAGPARFGVVESGGTFRIGTPDLAFTNGLDPTGEYSTTGWTLYPLMLRTLLGSRHTAGAAGAELLPDLAEDLPEVSPDGRTYTFTLKQGVRFAPPVSREVTARDIAYAFERMADRRLGAQYAFYYSVIDGFDAAAAGTASRITGIATPDDRTIVFTLTEPAGDFAARLALPATAPIPAEVARCSTTPGEYGRYLVATGPYMLEGSERLAVGDCSARRPVVGHAPGRWVRLVRNPEYRASTDSAEQRQSLPDRFTLTVNTNVRDIYDRIERGLLEAALTVAPPSVVRAALSDPDRRERVRVNAADRIFYIAMNLTTPPFDDVHVRRAMNLAVDLDGLRRAAGGEVAGDVATHALPDGLLADTLGDYRPLQQPPFTGDASAARAEMALSRYDTDGDGRCDADACDDVRAITMNITPWKEMAPIIRSGAASIGVDLDLRAVAPEAAYATSGAPAERVALSAQMVFSKDLPDPGSFMAPFTGASILPQGSVNVSLVGLTPARAAELGIPEPEGGVPSVDEDIRRCTPMAGDERIECFAAIDRRLTEEIVPSIPYLDANTVDVIGPRVSAYDFNQWTGTISLPHVAVGAGTGP